ncbi:ABC transporter ATP-binding protein [Ilumatobacter nonamiensis]|uniref:ABC transporter ATP-binding protein n=1 Tax=Ilumatobacter nonamiensis TaxID=467093 RepID=UPI000349E11A|nr:ABC transporter ATP-binding protein [Ilumatobacter nonamiensis]
MTAGFTSSLESDETALTTIRRGLREVPVLRNGLWWTFALAAIGSGGRVVVPILIQQAIDKGIDVDGSDSVDVALVARLSLIGLVAVLVAGVAFRQAAVRLGVRSEQALYDLRERLIGHILALSLADHGDERRGGLVARVTSDIETLAQFFQWGGMSWMRNSALMLIVSIVMVAYDPLLALVAFVVAFPLAVVLRAVQKRLVRAHSSARERNGEMLGALAEVVSGATTIRAYEAGDHLGGVVRTATARKARQQIRAAWIGAFLFPSGEVFSVFTVSAVIGVGVWQGPANGLTAGALVGFVFLTYRFLEPIAEFTEIIDQTQTAVAGLRRVLTVLDMPVGPPAPEQPVDPPAGSLGIGVHDVRFRYPNTDVDVLRDIDLDIPAGQQVAMVGATGSGKTTLGRLIARFADPSSGSISIGGVDVSEIDPAVLRRRLVVVSQEPFLFDDTVLANIAFSRPGSTQADIERVIADLAATDWIDALDHGLATRVGERGETLSAGERQLIALIRAGLADPDVLILDEATSSVDALTEVRVARALDRLAAGRTTIAIAHRLSTAARADRVLVLEDGRVVEDGHHAELLTLGGTYRRLHDAWISATTVAGSAGSSRPASLQPDVEPEGERPVDRGDLTGQVVEAEIFLDDEARG